MSACRTCLPWGAGQVRRFIFQVQEPVMTQKQRLKYSILIALAVLATMFGLSYLQNTGVISEKINRSMVQIRQMVEELVQSGHATETNTQSLLDANGRVIALMGRFKVR
jgi:hypothetical protein